MRNCGKLRSNGRPFECRLVVWSRGSCGASQRWAVQCSARFPRTQGGDHSSGLPVLTLTAVIIRPPSAYKSKLPSTVMSK